MDTINIGESRRVSVRHGFRENDVYCEACGEDDPLLAMCCERLGEDQVA